MLNEFALEDAAGLYTLRERQTELVNLVINTDKGISLGEKRAASILDAIDATRNLSLSQFLGSLGLDHLGKRRVHLMMQAAHGQLDTLDDWRSGKLRNSIIAETAGVPNIGGQIQDGIDAMAPVIDKLLAVGVTVLPPENDIPSSEEPSMKSLCISGKLPSGKKKSDYAEPLRAIGFELVDDVSKEIDYLVLADPNSSSSKAEKARKLGIAVISEEALEQLIAQGPEAQTLQKGEAPVKAASAPELPKKKAAPAKPVQPAAERQATPPSDGAFRRFEFNDGKSSKFWSIRIIGTEVEVRYGRIGTDGQSQVKAFDSSVAAEKHAGKLIVEKTGKGYRESA
jgi:predicted DNA-binding WGR domain protein